MTSVLRLGIRQNVGVQLLKHEVRSHAPEIVFLVGVVVRSWTDGKTHSTQIRGNGGEKPARFFRTSGNRRSAFGFDSTRGNAMAFAVAFADQLKQMVIMNVFDLVCQHHKFTIDLVKFAPLKMIAKLLAAEAERVAS